MSIPDQIHNPTHRVIPCKIARDDISPFIVLKDGLISRIDECDVAEVSRWNWQPRAHKHRPYLRRHHFTSNISLHRFLAGAGETDVVDHINGDTLDNRRANLRVCTRQQNGWNRRPNAKSLSGLKGVRPQGGKWVASIRVNSVRTHLGTFSCRLEAGRAYDDAARRHFGDFAFLNFSEARS